VIANSILILGLWGVGCVLIVRALCVTIGITIAIENTRWDFRSAGRRSAFLCVALQDRMDDHRALLRRLADSGRGVAYNSNFAAALSLSIDA
jgi:hypothetical protein